MLLASLAVCSLPLVLLLILDFDQQLGTAWRLDQTGNWWRHLLIHDVPGLLIASLVLPLVPLVAHPRRLLSRLKPIGPEYGIVLYLTGAQIGLLQAVNQHMQTDSAKTRLLGILGAAYLYTLICATTPDARALRRWLAGVTLGAGVLALLTLSLLDVQLPVYALNQFLVPLLAPLRDRGIGPFDHWYFFEAAQRLVISANGVGNLSMVVFAIAVPLAFFSGTWAERLWPMLLACVSGVLLLASGSRGAVLGCLSALGILWVAMSSLRRRRLSRLLMPAAAGSLALVLLIAVTAAPVVSGAPLIPEGYSGKEGLLATLDSRLRVWFAYWDLIRWSPVFGVGLGLQSVALAYAIRHGLNIYFSDPHAHNLWLQTYLEQTAVGVVGLGMIVVATGRAARHTLRSAQGAANTRSASLGAPVLAGACGVGAMMVQGLFDVDVATNVGTALMFALAAIVVRGARLCSEPMATPSEMVITTPIEQIKGAAIRAQPAFSPSLLSAAWAVAAVLAAVTLAGAWSPTLPPPTHIR